MASKVYLEYSRESVVPFSSFLGAAAPTTPTKEEQPAFPRFRDLLPELILDIYEMCDAGTLFQLMRASPACRDAAVKLFWAHPHTYFCFPGHWLLGQGGAPGYVWHCRDFARSVQQIEIDFDMIASDFDHEIGENLQKLSISERVKTFWRAFSSNFPSAQRIVLYQSQLYDLKYTENVTLPELFTVLTHESPSHIKLSFSIRRSHNYHPCERLIFKLAQTTPPSWTWELDCGRERIIPPNKPFRGPVGAFQHYQMRHSRLNLEEKRIRHSRLAFYEKHHFSEKDVCAHNCLNPYCDITFTERGEWSKHALESSHDEMIKNFVTSNPFNAGFRALCCISSDIESQMFEDLTKFKDSVGEWIQELRVLRAAYRNGSKGDTNTFVEQFVAQLESDPDVKHHKSARQCSTFRMFVSFMSNPVWVG